MAATASLKSSLLLPSPISDFSGAAVSISVSAQVTTTQHWKQDWNLEAFPPICLSPETTDSLALCGVFTSISSSQGGWGCINLIYMIYMVEEREVLFGRRGGHHGSQEGRGCRSRRRRRRTPRTFWWWGEQGSLGSSCPGSLSRRVIRSVSSQYQGTTINFALQSPAVQATNTVSHSEKRNYNKNSLLCHQVTLFTRGKAPITQQLPGESDAEYAEFSSKVCVGCFLLCFACVCTWLPASAVHWQDSSDVANVHVRMH